MKSTHTFAVLEVPAAIYKAIRAHLARAEYDHAFLPSNEGEVIDIHGIALRSMTGGGDWAITINTLLGRDHEGKIDFSLNGELAQFDMDKAREIVKMLQEAIECAVSDQLMFAFLKDKVGLSPQAAAAALLDFREMRQGSRGIVHPH
jgi:hypothetical protein